MSRASLEDPPRVCNALVLSRLFQGRHGYGPAPTKLYLPIVSVVAALSKRNDSLDFDLPDDEPGCLPKDRVLLTVLKP